MTLVVAMIAKDGIVLAADSRGTIGDPRGLTAIDDSHMKLYQLGQCGLALAGASEMGASLLDELRMQGHNGFQDVDHALKTLIGEFSNYFSDWFGQIPVQQRPGVLFTLAGYRKVAGHAPEPKIYSLTSQANFAPSLHDTVCMAGVPQYAVYLVHRYYDRSIPVGRAEALCEYLIAETASQDPKVGGPVRMARILPDSGYEELPKAHIQAMARKNQQLNRKLRRFFLEE